MTTVACVWVRGEYPYTAEYVERLFAMVRRWMDRPYTAVCLTDQPDAIPDGVVPVVVPTPTIAGCWAKLELFNPARGWSGRVLYLDLDSLIVASLQPILDVPAAFAATADPPQAHRRLRERDRFGRRIVRRVNSSVMVWDAGAMTDLYTRWTPADGERLSGDQDWIGEQVPQAARMDRAWFPRISEVRPPWPAPAKVILVKHPKNHVAAAQWPWFDALWRAA